MKAFALTGAAAAVAALCCIPAHSAPSYQVVKKVSLPGDTGWDYLYADSAGHRVYITRGSMVQVVDTNTNTLVGTIPNLNGIHGVAIDHKSGRGFVSNGRSNSVTVFNLDTLQPVQEIPVGTGPDCIIFDPATERVFTFNGRSQDSTAIDAATGKVLGTISLGGRPEYAVADGKGHVYDNLEDKSEVVSIDSRALKVDKSWSIAPGDGPSGIAMDTKHRRLYSVCGNQMMVVSDPDAGKVATTVTIGNGPDACAFDPHNQEVFAPAGRDGTIWVLHEASPDKYDLVNTATTQGGARTLTCDDKTHMVYTVTAQFDNTPNPNATGRPRFRFLPGTFTLIELSPGK